MSAISEFFLVGEAAQIDRAEPALVLGRMESLVLAELWACLQGVPFAIDMIDAFEILSEDGDDGMMLFVFPADFTARLAALPHARVGEIARAWTAFEEVGGDAGEMAGIVSRLCALGREAASKRTRVFLRLTL